MEYDNLVVISHLKQCLSNHTQLGLLTDDILHLFPLFQYIVFALIPRSTNRVAHDLASWALSLSDDFVIMKDTRPSLLSAVVDNILVKV